MCARSTGYATAVPIWIAWFLFLACSGPEPLKDPVAVAWRAADGHALVICEGGQRIRTFDPLLRPVLDRMLPVTVVAAAARPGGWLLQQEDGRMLDLAGGPVEADAATEFRAGLACAGPGSRSLRVDFETGVLTAGRADWEHQGEVEWGPGWAALRIRSSRILGEAVEWRFAGEPVRRASLRPDPDDPLLQIAWLQPVAGGVRIELRHRPPCRSYPPSAWSPRA